MLVLFAGGGGVMTGDVFSSKAWSSVHYEMLLTANLIIH